MKVYINQTTLLKDVNFNSKHREILQLLLLIYAHDMTHKRVSNFTRTVMFWNLYNFTEKQRNRSTSFESTSIQEEN